MILETITCPFTGTELIVLRNKIICPSEKVDVICSYPDVNEMVDGKPKYCSTRPTWIDNGVTLYPDGSKYTMATHNNTSEILTINLDLMEMDEIVNMKLGCYFTFTSSSNGYRNLSTNESIIPPGELLKLIYLMDGCRCVLFKLIEQFIIIPCLYKVQVYMLNFCDDCMIKCMHTQVILNNLLNFMQL